MKVKLAEEESKKRNVFTYLNFVKSNKINYKYKDCVNKIKNVADKLENLIDLIDESIGKDNSFYKKNKKRPASAQSIRRPDKIFLNDETKKKVLISSWINKNREFMKEDKKNKYKLKVSKSMIFNKTNKKYKDYNFRKIKYIKCSSNIKQGSFFIGNKLSKRESKFNTNKFKNHSLSTRNKIFNSNTSTNKVNNSSTITVYYPKYYMTTKNKRPKSAHTYQGSMRDYAYKKNKFKNVSSINTSKNFSRSRYRSLTNIYFDNSDYSKLRSKYLLDFLKESNDIKNSYKKALKDVYLKKDTRDLMKIAQKEIKMKDPDYYKKEIFKNIIKVKKTLNYVKKMRDEQKYKMDYFGPGNINNKGYIRKKNANLIRFCDQICHMKDEKFYMYQKLLNELYPNLLKNAVKTKYKMSEKDVINEKEIQKNEETIKKLFSILKKY